MPRKFPGFAIVSLPIHPRAMVVLAWVAACFAFGAPLQAAEFHIANGDSAGLIDAINAANADPTTPATIHLANNGTYVLTTAVSGASGTGTPQITSKITINGNGATVQRSFATGIPNFRIFIVAADGDATMNDLTVRAGHTTGFGAGINNVGALTLNNCTVTENSGSSQGGGIYNTGVLTLNGTTISDNFTGGNGGGGVYSVGAAADLTISESTISGNTATGSGGGIYNSVSAGGSGGLASIVNSIVSHNTTTGVNGQGGGIYNSGQMTIVGGEITGNAANRSGGGIYGTHGGIRFLDVTDTLIGNNTAEDHGGGIFTTFGSTTLSGVTISNNIASGDGGGIIHSGTTASHTLTIGESIIFDNTATIGGGIHSSRALILSDSVISENTAPGGGGGIAQTGSPLDLHRTTVADNATEADGGGLFISSTGTITLNASTISGNAAGGDGGGIHRQGLNIGRITATNCTLSGNTAAGVGGGINLVASGANRIHLINTTVFANVAAEGGGIHNAGSNAGVAITNSIVAGSTGGDIVGGYVDVIYNMVEDGAGLTNPTSMTGSPGLAPLADNGGATLTHALLPGSMAIDAGDCSVSAGPEFAPVGEDQRGVARPQGAACDIGAFEKVPPVPGDINGDGAVDVFDLLLLLENWGTCADPRDCPADLNGDGAVDVFDLLLLLEYWG